jgi:hypothetical protein
MKAGEGKFLKGITHTRGGWTNQQTSKLSDIRDYEILFSNGTTDFITGPKRIASCTLQAGKETNSRLLPWSLLLN